MRNKNQVHWARQYLVNFCAIENSSRGACSLTSKGKNLHLNGHKESLDLFYQVQSNTRKNSDSSSVKAHHVRDFRGAIQGRANKGLIITTGFFTKGVIAEAIRDGVPAIDLIDGKALVELFEKIELG